MIKTSKKFFDHSEAIAVIPPLHRLKTFETPKFTIATKKFKLDYNNISFPNVMPGQCGRFNEIIDLDTWIQNDKGGSFVQNVQFRQHEIPKKLKYFVPKVPSYPRWTWFTTVFNNSLWVCYIASLLTVAVTLKCIATSRFSERFHNYRSTSYCLICAWSIFLNLGVKNIPTIISFRAVFFSWIVYCVSVSTVFQAFVTSYFVLQVKEHQIEEYTLVFDSMLKNIIHYSNKSFYFHSASEALMYFVPKVPSYPRWIWFTTVFSNSLWVCYIASLLTVAVTIKCIASSRFSERFHNYRSTSYCLICAWSIFLNLGFSSPVYCVSVNTVFQAFVTSYFVFQVKEHQIDTYDELQTEGYTLVFDSMLKNIIHYSNKSFYFHSASEALMYTLNTPNTALYITDEFFKFYTNNLCTNQKVKQYHMLSQYEDSNNYNGLVTDSTIQSRVNEILKRLANAGIVQKIFDDVLTLIGRKLNSDMFSRLEYHVIDLLCLQSCFYFMISGISLSVFLFLLEIIFKPEECYQNY
ncbi:hypothetical protein C0J52_20507 [Blattella germanica]|nr:hypothetical protein C0J52_20507 [Blattella germanica]